MTEPNVVDRAERKAKGTEGSRSKRGSDWVTSEERGMTCDGIKSTEFEEMRGSRKEQDREGYKEKKSYYEHPTHNTNLPRHFYLAAQNLRKRLRISHETQETDL